MAKEFFVGWALWQKMTFVLACAIVLTIGAGWLKVWYMHYKVKKYTTQGARTTQQPQMVEAGAATRRDTGDVPFGIRAIQSGIQVDGIWISGTNTPVPASPVSTAQSKPGSSASSRPVSAIEMPQPAMGPSSRPTSSGAASAFERAVSAERLPSSRDSSPGAGPSSRGARQHRPPPTAYSRYSQSSMLRHSATLDVLEGQEMYEKDEGLEPVASIPLTLESNSSRKSSGSSENNPADRSSSDSDSLEVNTRLVVPRPRDPRTDLQLLHNHRLSHVAETGSLARREKPFDRTPGRSGEWASMAYETPSTRMPTRPGPPSPPSPISPPSPPTPPIASGPNPFVAPLETIISPTRDNHPQNVAAQASPLLETYQPSGPDFGDDVGASFHKRSDSQVLRKVNSGFEILRPGTFTFPYQPEDSPASQKHQTKRLQKKRRPSTDSRVSSFVEQV